MPMFFFETFDGEVSHFDRDGLDCPSKEHARREALSAIPDMARDTILNGDFRVFRSLVRDACGTVVYEASMTFVGRWPDAGDEGLDEDVSLVPGRTPHEPKRPT